MVLSNRRLLCFSKTWATPSPTTPIVETIVRAALARIQAAVGKRETVNLERWVVMQAPTGQRFCVVRVQRPGFPKNANRWD
jgi:hypothetical protein